MVSEEEDVPFDVSLGENTGEEGSSCRIGSVVREPGTNGEARMPIPVRFEAGIGRSGRDRYATLTSAEPEVNVPTLHSSTEDEPAEPTVSSIEVEFDDSPETTK